MESFLVSSAVAHNVVGCYYPEQRRVSDEFHQRNTTRHADKKGKERNISFDKSKNIYQQLV